MKGTPAGYRNDNRQKELVEFLEDHFVGSLTGGDSDSCVIFFALAEGKLVFKSRTTSRHSLIFADNPKASFTTYHHSSNYSDKYGAQIRGFVRRINNTEEMYRAVEAYAEKHKGAKDKISNIESLCQDNASSTFYYFVPTEFKIIDESSGGDRSLREYVKYTLEA